VYQFIVEKDIVGEYRWTLVTTKGEKLAQSIQHYKSSADCLYAIQLLKTNAPSAPVFSK